LLDVPLKIPLAAPSSGTAVGIPSNSSGRKRPS
jgi:hypothetical protein